ncbi:MAG: tetratricopeptide repeat protein [Candidatus Omnitrophica bacterium]|nr:tetratricopeptide repeat protein [Candidatus Omnitrophota bacterium]
MKSQAFFARVVVGVLFFWVVCLTMKNDVLAQEQLPEFKDWVSDSANILSFEYKAKMTSLIDDLRVKTSTEIAVVVAPNTGSYSDSNYAQLLLDQWKLGQKDGRGVVLLLVVSDHRWTWHVQAGPGLKEVLTNSSFSKIGEDQMTPYFNQEKYSEGLYYAVAAMANIIDQSQDARIKETIDKAKADVSAGLYDETIEKLNKVLEIDPYYPDAYWSRAGVYIVKGNYDQALSDYNQALEFNPNSVEAYSGRGALYDEKGNYDAAISDLTKAITINPNYSEAYRNRASTYDKKGSYNPALVDINKAIELDPKISVYYFARAVVYFHLAEYQKSWEDAMKANTLGYKVDPLFFGDVKKALKQEAFDNAQKAYGKGKFDEAIVDLNKVLEIDPQSFEAYSLRASMNASNGHLDLAIADYSKAIEINPKDDTVLNNRAATYYYQKDYQKSWEDVHKIEELGAKVNPKFLETLKKDSGREK